MSDSRTVLPAPKLLKLIDVSATENAITLAARTSSRVARCPACGTRSARVHSHYTRMLADLPWQGIPLDPRGRVVKLQIGDLLPVSYGYNDQGKLETIAQGTGLDTRSFSFTYDGDGYLETITDPLSHTTGFRYDKAGRVITLTRPDGEVVGYSYDANGNNNSFTPPGRLAHGFPDYTPVNLVSEHNPPDVDGIPDKISYRNTKDRQLEQITGPDGQTVVARYAPPSGRLDTLTLANGQMLYTYYPTSGNLESITTPDGTRLSCDYDGALLTSEKWTGAIAGSVEHTYDNDLRVASQSINSAQTIVYKYDRDDLLIGAGDLVLHRDPQKGLRAGLLTGTTLGIETERKTMPRTKSGTPQVTKKGVHC